MAHAAEGVGLDDVGAGREVVLVDLADGVGTRQDEVLVAALEIGTAEVGGKAPESLDAFPEALDEEDDDLPF